MSEPEFKISPRRARNMKNLSLNLSNSFSNNFPNTSKVAAPSAHAHIEELNLKSPYFPFKPPRSNSIRKNPLSLSIPANQDKMPEFTSSSDCSSPLVPATPLLYTNYNHTPKTCEASNQTTYSEPSKNTHTNELSSKQSKEILINHFSKISIANNESSHIIQQIPEYNEFHGFSYKNNEELEQNQLDAYPEGPKLILENLYLYSEPTIDDIKSFDLVINVAKEIKDHTPEIISKNEDIEYVFRPWSHTSSVSKDLPKLTAKIESYLNQGKKILIHCQCGVSRSATLIIGYFIYKFKLSVNDAYNLLKSKVPKICPNMSLIFELMEFYEYCENNLNFKFNNNSGDEPSMSVNNNKNSIKNNSRSNIQIQMQQQSNGGNSYLSPDSPNDKYFHSPPLSNDLLSLSTP